MATLTYLGTLDDKSIEYPFSVHNKPDIDFDAQFLAHLLLTENPVLEEGFLFNVPEVAGPNDANRIQPVLEAAKAGLFRIISREHCLVRHAEFRAKQNYQPPISEEGRRAIADLNDAAVATGAFTSHRTPESLDELTYVHLRQLLTDDRIASFFVDLGIGGLSDFSAAFENAYRKGNGGRQWTARAAWEAAAKSRYGRGPAVPALMKLANRTRQVLRGASVARNQPDVAVQVHTGQEWGSEILLEQPSEQPEVPNADDALTLVPRVPLRALKQNYRAVIAELAEGGILSSQKQSYLAALDRWRGTGTCTDIVKRCVESYEACIYGVWGGDPSEHRESVNEAASYIAGAAVKMVGSTAMAGLVLSSINYNRDRLLTRKGFLMNAFGVAAGVAASTAAGNAIQDSATVAVLAAEDAASNDTRDLARALDWQHSLHSQVRIDRAAAQKYLAA